MSRLRVLVVDDSLTARRHLVELLSEHPDIEVIGEAADGQGAIDLCQRLRPDVMTLDMVLPGKTGVQVTEHVMAYCPLPILIVSSSTNRADLMKTYDALAAGAVDVLDKPTAANPAWERELVAAVRRVARIRVIRHPRARLAGYAQNGAFEPVAAPEGGFRLVAIGASTGGPAAVLSILASLPADFRLPIAVVLHIGAAFGGALSEWLRAQLPFAVREAVDGEPVPAPGRCTVFLADGGRHLAVRGGVFRLTDDPERYSCRPSVDVLFESVAAELGPAAVGCLLTGMGKDGAAGLLALRRAGAHTIAQDEETSVIYGMPGEAARLGAAREVLPVQDIGPRITALSIQQGRTAS